MQKKEMIKKRLIKIYGVEKGESAFKKLYPQLEQFSRPQIRKKELFSENDIVLITYANSLYKKGESPLQALHGFAGKFFKDVFSDIHFLPFFPFSSDDGFSIIDYHAVDPANGTWNEIKETGADFGLMFDLVLNHISAKSRWFAKYLDQEQGYADLAIEVDPETDLSQVTRPRSLPLLTQYPKTSGQKVNVWTTFSADQIDLNFASVDVLSKIVGVMLDYIRRGASILRLDAIAYLWKETGTSCIHLEKTHEIVKLLRSILDLVAPEVIIITETNVPHKENISYFGNGVDEAQMVYNFTLPPLMLYTFMAGDSTNLCNWAKGLGLKSKKNTFFNFSASHDGIGVRPLEGILEKDKIEEVIALVKENGGQVSYKNNPDGSKSPYELNITYVDAVGTGKQTDDPWHAARFLASQAIQLVLPGVPAIYIHSILGSHNWQEGVSQTKRARTINRQKLDIDDVMKQLRDPASFRSTIFYPYINLIKIRKKQSPFHPTAFFKLLEINSDVFAIERRAKGQTIYALTNITNKPVSISMKPYTSKTEILDLISEKIINPALLTLTPYQSVWLRNGDETTSTSRRTDLGQVCSI